MTREPKGDKNNMGDSTANTTVDVVNDEQEVVNRRIRESLDGGNPTVCFVELEVTDEKELTGKNGENEVVKTGKSGSNSIFRAFGESIALALKSQIKSLTDKDKKTATTGVKAKKALTPEEKAAKEAKEAEANGKDM